MEDVQAAAVQAGPGLAGEERLLREAILMVASNRSPRVILAGLEFGEVVLEHLRVTALEAGVRVRPRHRRAETTRISWWNRRVIDPSPAAGPVSVGGQR